MFNSSSNEVLFLLNGQKLEKAITKSLDQAKQVMLVHLGKRNITATDVTSGSKNPLNRATLFKFFEDHNNDNVGLYNRTWVQSIFLLSNRADSPLEELKIVFTKKGKLHKITNQFRGSLKLDAKLLMHLLWCNKAVLLPYGYPLPYYKGYKEYAACTYPEVLAIAQKVHLKAECLEKYPDLFMPMESRDNFSWYFKNFVRSSTWWKVEDISNDDINEILTSDLSGSPTKRPNILMLRTWLGFFEKSFPERVKFKVIESLSNKIATVNVENGKRNQTVPLTTTNVSSVEHFSFLPKDQVNTLAIWLKHIDLWVEKLGHKKIITAHKKRAHVIQLINYFVYEVYHKTKNIPIPNQFTRDYIDGVEGKFKGLNSYLMENRSPSSVQNIIYNINQFFDFLTLYKNDIGGFTNIMSLNIDVPYVPRRKGTVKKIFPSEFYASFLSYLYGLVEWVWWMNRFCQTERGISFVARFESSVDKRLWMTSDTGFIPITWHEGKAIPIHVVPNFIAPIIYREMKYKPGEITASILPNYIHIALVLAETGIRSSHVHWLDSRTYDEFVDRKLFNPYSFDITKLNVNTDKVNGAWVCNTSQSVIGVLDRQKEYQDTIVGENIKELVDYSWSSNSPYEPIECLFSLGTASRKQFSKKRTGPSNPDTFGSKYRCMLYGFNVVLSSFESFEPFMSLEETDKKINTEDYFKALYPRKRAENLYKTEITPHSARSQVVSQYITLLPPNIIKSITGHVTDSHVVYYAQLDNKTLDKARNDTVTAMQEGILFDNKLSSIKAEDVNSKLREAFKRNREGALQDFGATSFSSLAENKGSSSQLSGLLEIKKKPADQIAFNSTHICPFDNQCPKEVVKEFKGAEQLKPCGRCFYAVKTVDHIPRIYGKIRALSDECSDLESYIQDAKTNNVSKILLEEASERRRILADEIIGWTVSAHCLEKMANELSSMDTWLVEKPELLSQQIEKIECKDGDLENLLYRIAEAKTHAEFFTASLKHQVIKARTKILAHTQQYNQLLQDSPDDYTLLDEFRGQIKSICDVANISVSELSSYFDRPLISGDSPKYSKFLSLTDGGSDAKGK